MNESPLMLGQNGFPSTTVYPAALQGARDTFFEGLRTFGQGMNALAEGIKQHRQNVQDQSAADTAFPMLTKLMTDSGMQPDPDVIKKFGSASLSAKKGMIGSMSMQLAMKTKADMDAAQREEMAARSTYYGDVGAARAAAEQEKEDTDTGLNALFQQFADMKPSGQGGEWTQNDVIKAVGAAKGRLNPRAQAALIKQVFPTVMGGGVGGKPAFMDVPGTSSVLTTFGKSAFVVPKTGTVDVQQVPVGGGETVPVVQTPRGNVVQLRTGKKDLTDKDLLDSYQADLKMLNSPGAMLAMSAEDRAAQRAEIQGKIEALRAKGKGPAAAAVEPPQAHIDYLKLHPEAASSFDTKYGEGAAAKYLKAAE